jgi:hypothetical protein
MMRLVRCNGDVDVADAVAAAAKAYWVQLVIDSSTQA